MKRNVPSKKQKTAPWYRCPTRGCNCRAIKCDLAEDAILEAMREWLKEYTIEVETDQSQKTNPIDTALSIVREQIEQLQAQQDSACEYLEKGIYTVEMFTKRNDVLSRELRDLRASEADLLRKRESKEDGQNAEKEIIPAAQKLLDSYQQLTIPEKNKLWKMVLEKVTIYRTPEGEISLHIYPKLPKKV